MIPNTSDKYTYCFLNDKILYTLFQEYFNTFLTAISV